MCRWSSTAIVRVSATVARSEDQALLLLIVLTFFTMLKEGRGLEMRHHCAQWPKYALPRLLESRCIWLKAPELQVSLLFIPCLPPLLISWIEKHQMWYFWWIALLSVDRWLYLLCVYFPVLELCIQQLANTLQLFSNKHDVYSVMPCAKMLTMHKLC